MSGAGGITIFLAPNGVSTFVFTDSGQDAYGLNSPGVAESIRPYPEPGLPNVSLMSDGPAATGSLVATAIAAAMLAGVGLLVWRVLHTRRQNRAQPRA
jgi:hypothetical protein